MALNIKLQMYRGLKKNLPTTTTLPGVIAWTTDSDELYIDNGSAFQRLSPNNRVWTATSAATLRSLVTAAGGNALLGDLALNSGNNTTYLLVGYASTTWQASTVYAVGQSIIDANGNLQTVTAVTNDDKSGASEPTWATSGTTTDNHVTWTEGAGFVAIGTSVSGVTSVNGFTGAVTLTLDNITDGTTYARIVKSVVTAGEFDLAKSHQFGFTSDNLIQPSSVGTYNVNQSYALGAVVADPVNSGKVQQVVVAGTSGSGSPPASFSNTKGVTTVDNTVTWENIGTFVMTSVQWLASGTTHQFVSFIGKDGTQHLAQPAFTDLSGTLAQTQLPSSIGSGSSLTSIDLGTF